MSLPQWLHERELHHQPVKPVPYTPRKPRYSYRDRNLLSEEGVVVATCIDEKTARELACALNHKCGQ
jgi:hypothetical protein